MLVYTKNMCANMYLHAPNSFDLKNSSGMSPVLPGIVLTLKQRRPESAKVCRQCWNVKLSNNSQSKQLPKMQLQLLFLCLS